MLDDVNWDHLRSLLAFARGGTFTAAAKMLGVKHSTVSRHLSEIEQQIRSKIVYRDVDGLKLTLAGERLVVSAEVMEAQFRQARDDIAGRDSLLTGTVRIGAPDGFGAMFLAPRLHELADRFPSLEIQLVAMPRVFNLTNREADIAVSLALPDHGRLIGRKLSDYSLGLYAANDYLRKSEPILKISDLKNHRFVNYIDDLIAINELDYLDEVSKDVSATFQSSSIIAQANATASGSGLCVLPYFIAKTQVNLVRVLRNDVSLIRTWYILVHETQKDLGKIKAVVDFVVGIVRESTSRLLFS
jgi:DNA-binding transcriptional LysR family regulator